MVEQDFLISQAVAAIFEDPFLKGQLAMRGGTVLHKAHLAPPSRYSEDIDLVLVGNRPAGHIKKALVRVLLPLLGRPAESVMTDIQLTVRNLVAKSKIIRSTYTYDPTSEDAALAHLKVEVNTNEKASFFPLVPVQVLVPGPTGVERQVTVVSYDLDEMLGTKLRALLQREHGRDLFDIVWAWTTARQPGAAVFAPRRLCAILRGVPAASVTRMPCRTARMRGRWKSLVAPSSPKANGSRTRCVDTAAGAAHSP